MTKINFAQIFTPKSKKVLFINICEGCAYILCLLGLIYYVGGVFEKYFFDPHVTTTERQRQVHEIPFPAVTICSPVVMKSHFANIKEYYRMSRTEGVIINLTETEKNFLAAKAQICVMHQFNLFEMTIKNVAEKDVAKLLKVSAPSIGETFVLCSNNNRFVMCELTRSLTELGLCYTFNMQGYDTIFNEEVISSDFEVFKGTRKIDNIWTLEKGYSVDDKMKIPHRAAVGYPYGFLMAVNKSDLNDLCSALVGSFKYILHLPNEIPNLLHDSDHIDLNTGIVMKISATSTKSETFLEKYPPDKRRCYFEGERKLQFFRSYTKNNCDFECLTNFTLRKCGCVSFFHPRTETTPICDFNKVLCSREAVNLWPHMDEMSNTSMAPCNCFPTCSNIKYFVKRKQVTELGVKSALFVIHELAEANNNSQVYAGLNIEVGDFLITEYENSVGYKLENFIADFGGLLGLFLGFSFTTVIKFIRQFIMRRDKKATKIQPHIARPSNSSWLDNVDNREDLVNLLIWQAKARERAFHQKTLGSGKLKAKNLY